MTFPAIVPPRRPNPVYSRILAGAPVAAGAWRAGLGCAHYAMGEGIQIIPEHSPGTTIAAGTNRTLRYRVRGSYAAVLRRWTIWAAHPTNAGTPRITVTVPAGGSALPARAAASFRGASRPLHFDETLAAVSSAEVEASINIAVADYNAKILGVSAWEYPRISLALSAAGETLDDGANPETVVPRAAMLNRSYESIEGVAEASANAFKALRRSLYQWARPDTTTDAKLFNAAAWTDGLVLAAPVQGFKRHIGETTVTVHARVYAATTAGGDGSVRFNTASGGTGVGTITGIAGTSFAWYPSTAGAPLSFSIQCEDLAAADGRQASTWETLMWQAIDNVGDLYVATVSVWQPPP